MPKRTRRVTDGWLSSLVVGMMMLGRLPSGIAQEATTAAAHASTIELSAGEVQSLSTQGLERVAIGDPSVADVVVVSENELLVKAEHAGETDLLVWDAEGKRTWKVAVASKEGSKAATTMSSLRHLLDAEGLSGLVLRAEGDQVYVSGRLASSQEEERLAKILETFPKIVNLVQKAVATEQAAPLVELEVRIIEISKDMEQNLGVDWQDSIKVEEVPFTATSSDLAESIGHRVNDIVRLGALKRTAFQAILNHLLTEGKARILAAPNLVTLSGKPATTFLGGEIPVITANTVGLGTATQNVEFKPIGTRLTITPTVSGDRSKINSEFESELRTIDKTNAIIVAGITVPGFKVRKTKTEVMSHPDETIVIAGLVQNEQSETSAKVPKISRIPFFGRFFSNNDTKLSEVELIVVVTPSLPRPYPATPPVTPALHADAAPTGMAQAPPAAPPVIGGNSALLQPPSPAPGMSPTTATGARQLEAMTTTLQSMNSQEPVFVMPSAASDPVTDYARTVQQRIADGLAAARPEMDTEGGAVRLGLRVRPNGSLREVIVVQSSGNAVLDQSVVTTARAQAPYPAFPAALTQPDLWLEVPVVFNPG